MHEQNEDSLRSQLASLDASIFFLLLVIFSVILSLYALHVQRGQAAQAAVSSGQTAGASAPDVFPVRLCASALVIGALGFFLCLALSGWRQAAQGQDCAARRSAAANLSASLLVFLAALLRLDDLLETRRRQAEEATV